MESIPKNSLLKYNIDTLQCVRSEFGFDTLKRVNDAIDSLEDWILKQEHFEKKNFDREYLERLLIFNKGSVEKAKKKLDKLCTFRTLIPEFFSTDPIDKEKLFESFNDVLLTRMTPDHSRVYLIKPTKKFSAESVDSYLKYFVLVSKYLQMKDYCSHLTFLADYTDSNMMEYLKYLNFFDARKCSEIAFEGFSLRIKAVHMITGSKVIDTFVSAMKPILGPKINERIQLHKSMEDIYKYVPKEILPQEYGGNDKSLSELKDDLYNELYSKDFTEYRQEMNKARTIEAFRQKDKFNEEYLGVSGTFRTMTVD